jgi:beta-N-acetylhexosaminidase
MVMAFLSFEISTAYAQADEIVSIIASMTLEHKVGQMFMVNLYGADLTDAGREMLETWRPGVVVLLESNIQSPIQIARLTNAYQQTITNVGGVPLFVATDQEGGVIARLRDGFTTFPAPMLLTAADDPDLTYRVGQAMAGELQAVGVNMDLAPVADLLTNINNPIIGRRSPGSDPEMVGSMISSLIAGMQSTGVMATTKHFPGHGDTSEDSHVVLPQISFGQDRLESIELAPFISAIDAGTGAIMVAHIWYPAFDPGEPIPSSLSYSIVTGLLRVHLGYDGIIMTDALDMDAVDTRYTPEDASILAVKAGVDLIAIGANAGEAIQSRAMQAVVNDVRSGEIDEAQIDASVRRIISAKALFNVLNWTPLDPNTTEEHIFEQANEDIVEEMFHSGVTLTHNRGDLLPILSGDSVAIVFPANRNIIRRECSSYNDNIRFLGVSDYPTDDEITSARTLSAQVEKLVVFANDAYDNESETMLVNALPPDKVINVALRSPFDLLRFPTIGAYLITYSPLDPAIRVVCGILFGAYPARGRLSVDLTANLKAGMPVITAP